MANQQEPKLKSEDGARYVSKDAWQKRKEGRLMARPVKKCIKEADIYQKFHPVIIQEQKGEM